MCSFVHLSLDIRIPSHVKGFLPQAGIKGKARQKWEWQQWHRRYGGTCQPMSGLDRIEWAASLDTGHQPMSTPAKRRFRHTLLVFFSTRFFQAEHFMKSLLLGPIISDPFFITVLFTRSNDLVWKRYSVSFVLCFMKGPVVLWYFTTWWFQYERCLCR